MKTLFTLFLILLGLSGYSQDFRIVSPDGKLELQIETGTGLSFQLLTEGKLLMKADDLNIYSPEGSVLNLNPKRIEANKKSVSEIIYPEIREKSETIENEYTSLSLKLNRDWKLEFRLFNDGCAYRFLSAGKESRLVQNETFRLSFSEGDSLLGMQEHGFRTSYERPYVQTSLATDTIKALFSLPCLVLQESGTRIWIGESGLENYPNLFLEKTAEGKLVSSFPKKPASEGFDGNAYGWGQVKTEQNIIAEVPGNFIFPWRIFAMAKSDMDLLSNQLVYQLAPECRIEDPSWIEPGWVILDWWARRNIYGVDFETGSNTKTARYFIDFCADYGVKYFLFDDGWSELQDLMAINPDLDMAEVMSYAREKGVKIILWVHWNPLRQDMEKVLDQFQQWGVAGIKVDFMNRSDQDMVQFYWKVAEEAAKRHMVVNFHGAYKPAGLRRAYPNVLTREGLIEFEYSGVSELPDPDLHNTLPFLRNVAGPMDFIPGTMLNATRKDYYPVLDRPMGKGTRAHSLALAVVFESPMQMIPDSPNDYYSNEESARFLLQIPTVWDETVPIQAKIGDQVVLARRSGTIWYLAGITDWNPAEFEVPTRFLPEGDYWMEQICDGPNADKRAVDYQKSTVRISSGDLIKMKLMSGGGWVARISLIGK